MSNKFSIALKKKILGKNQNLVSIDEPFEVMKKLLGSKAVSNILDAGASDGRITRRLLRKFPASQAYAFEPNPMYAAALKDYARRDSRFHPVMAALSDRSGTADLFVTESPGNTSLLSPSDVLKDIDPAGAAVKKAQPVELMTIDGWVVQQQLKGVELMKFDIQGAELKALAGGRQTLTQSTLLVYTEIWFNSPYEGGALYSEIDLFLRQCGFGLYDLYGPKYGKDGKIMWANAIFIKE